MPASGPDGRPSGNGAPSPAPPHLKPARRRGDSARPPAPPPPGDAGILARHLSTPEAVAAVVEIAHDMRSPLTSILFLVETMRRGTSGPLTPAQERQLGLIYGAALGLNSIACDVLDTMHGAEGLFDGHAVPLSVAEIIFDICDTARPISEEKRLPMHQTLPVTDVRMGHPAALKRVLLNLLTNALKYTRSGSVSIGCTELEGDRVCLWVEDTGDGIPPHVMERLFESFRPAGDRMRFSNAGLGLAICEQFLQGLGSTLQVETGPDRGTRFFFELDLPPAAGELFAHPAAEAKASDSQ